MNNVFRSEKGSRTNYCISLPLLFNIIVSLPPTTPTPTLLLLVFIGAT